VVIADVFDPAALLFPDIWEVEPEGWYEGPAKGEEVPGTAHAVGPMLVKGEKTALDGPEIGDCAGKYPGLGPYPPAEGGNTCVGTAGTLNSGEVEREEVAAGLPRIPPRPRLG
jgi:hypothetical protein